MQPLESLPGGRTGYFEITANERATWKAARTAKTNNSNPAFGNVEKFAEGEWAIEDANDQLNKSTSGSAEIIAWPVVRGYEFPDTAIGSGTYAIVLGAGYRARTNGYNTGVADSSYAYGTPLCVKSGLLTPASTGDYVMAYVIKGPENIQTGFDRALGDTGFRVITIEVRPGGRAA